MYRYVDQYTEFYLLALTAEGPGSNDTSVAINISILVSLNILQKRNQVSLDKWLVPGLVQ